MYRRWTRTPTTAKTRLRVEPLEAREVPAVDLLGIADSEFPSNKPLFVPITSASADGDVTFSATSGNEAVNVTVLTGGRSVRFTVSGKDSNNQEFTGSFTIRLFEDIAPLATSNIIALVKNGYYDGKEFHRVVNDFVIQGGSPNGDGQGGSSAVTDARDEYNALYTFASRGIVAMANAGDDNNNAQFFITDPFILDGNNNETDAPLDRRSQFLNFNHTVVGILTSGFDTYQKIMNVPKVLGSDGAISSPVNDVKITDTEILDPDRRNGVVMIQAETGFLGSTEIKVTGSQGGVDDSETFQVTSVTDTVNDRPFLGAMGNITTTKNTAATFSLPFSELDAGDTPTFTVGRVVNTANGPVFTTLDPATATASVDANGLVTVTPATGFIGSFQITVGVRDAQDRIGSSLGLNDARNFDSEKLTVTVNDPVSPPPPTNTAPTISDIGNQTLTRDTALPNVAFTVTDAQTAAGSLTLSITSSNPTLVPTSGVIFGGSGTARTLTLTPATGQTGTSTMTVTVTDGGGLTATETFTVTVNAPTSPPPPPTVTLTSTKPTVGQGRNVLLTATVSSGTGSVQFLDGATVIGNIPVIDSKALLNTNFTTASAHSITAKFIPNSGDSVTSSPVTVTVDSATASPVIITAEGQVAGTDTQVVIKNQDGSTRFTVDPFPNFRGVITAKVADVNGDGQLDAVAVPGFGGGPLIVVFDGATGNMIYQRMIFEPHFRGGLSVDVGDAKGLGYGQILVGAGLTGGPRVTLLDAKNDTVLLNYFAYANTNRGGVSVAISDLRGGNQANIITGAGNGLAPTVNVYNPFSIVGFETPKLFGTFLAGSKADTTGIVVAAGPLQENNTRRDVLVGPYDKSLAKPVDQPFNPIALGVFVG